jgi:hypothetical protein
VAVSGKPYYKNHGLWYTTEAGHILYLWILYPIHIQALKKDIISYHYHGNKKDMAIYPISFVIIFASIVTVSEQQKARPGSTAANNSSTFYWIELKPWSISSEARKWQITAEMAETAVLKD